MSDTISSLLSILRRLREAHIHYELTQVRNDSVAIMVAVPGERWEIEVMANGALEIERFKSDGTIEDEAALERLFVEFGD